MFIYSIKGEVTYNDAETDSGYLTIEIDDRIYVNEMSTQIAKKKFFSENQHYAFFGSLISWNVKTGGQRGVTYRDRHRNQSINIDLIGYYKGGKL